MSLLSMSEAGSVQFPMVKHAQEIGWTPLTPEEARAMRGGDAGMIFRDELAARLRAFNSWLTPDAVRSIIETIDAIPPTMEGNRELLAWMRGDRQWHDENEKRHRHVTLIDFEHPDANSFHATWEWTLKPPARKGNRADVMFVVNGLPVCIVEHKNPKDGDAIERAIKQLRRYEVETPELLGSPQLFNVTHLIDYWYGVTWNATRRFLVRWKQAPEETYRFAVQAFFERHEFLRTLADWILFYVEDGELKKSVLRQHQQRAIDSVIARCADPVKKRALVWHTQGSGKTFTLLTAARLILEDKRRFANATVVLVVDRTEIEGQLKGWVDKLVGEMQNHDIVTAHARSKAELQALFDSGDFRGLIVSMIHKFDEIRKDSVTRDNVYVFIDEAHRSVAKDLGTYLMAALPNATIVGFTGTPIARTAHGEGTFKIFGAEDELGYLDKYSIAESIKDETTLPIKHHLAPGEMTLPAEQLDKEFFALAEAEEISDIDELNRVLDRAVGIRTFLSADDHIEKVAAFVANHFKENVLPLGYKAFLVAVNREACAKYKQALDKLLAPEWTEAIYSESALDVTDRPLVARLQLSEEREKTVRGQFKKVGTDPKLLIVTDKLLTGYDAPILYCMYRDKPMRDHVLLQAIARVNRPYVDGQGISKRVGLVIDFVSVLKDLRKALKFDSTDVSGVIEDVAVLLEDFRQRMAVAEQEYLTVADVGGADEKLESVVYGRFLDVTARKAFFDAFRHLEMLWEILSPSSELRDHIANFQRLTKLYAAVRQAYAEKTGFIADLAYKTRRLIEGGAEQQQLGRLSRAVTFDAETIEQLRKEPGSDEGKVFNLVRGLQKAVDDEPNMAPILLPLRERAERILKDLQDRKTSGLAALDLMAALAAEKDAAMKSADASGLSRRAFAVAWKFRDHNALKEAGLTSDDLAREAESLLERFPNANVNIDEKRHLRAALYRPLLKVPAAERAQIVDGVIDTLFPD